MKHLTYFFLATIFFCSCKTEPEKKSIPIVSTEAIQEPVKPFSNPSIIFGSSFGHYFQSLYRNNRFEEMLSFTSSQTINKFGSAALLDYYKHNFKLDFNIGKLTNISNEEGVIYLTYSHSSITATRRKVVIPCIVEHDTVRVIILKLLQNPFTNE